MAGVRSVLHVIPAIAPRYGGPSAAIAGMCRALEKAGVRTLIATTDADGPSGRLDVEHTREVTWNGLRVVFFPRHFGEAYKWSRGLQAWLDTHVSEFDAAHVHAVFSHASVAAGRASRAHRIPYLLRPLGTLDPWSVKQKPLRKRALMALGANRLITGAAAIHYTSQGEMRLAESVVPGMPRGAVVPLGIDDVFFAEPRTGERAPAAPFVLSLARLDPKKGIDALIRAFHVVASVPTLAPWRLVIAGSGSDAYVATLKALAANGAGAARIAFIGWVDGDRKVSLLRDASLFALPSHQENFGISLVEALACGVPAIVSEGVNLGAELTAAGAGWSVGEGDPALSARLISAMTDGLVRAAAASRARAFARAFQWDGVARQLIAEYERATASDEGRARQSADAVRVTPPASVH